MNDASSVAVPLLLGQAAALASALCWAVAVAMFRRSIDAYGARAVNLAKNAIACGLLGITMLAVGQAPALASAPPRILLWIALSGLLGLTIGDTALFASVGHLGPPRALLLQTTTPIWTALLAFATLGTRPSLGQWLGGSMILAGVILVVRQAPAVAPTDADRRRQRVGLLLGVLGAVCQAGGIVLAKEAMTGLPIVTASFVRLLVGGLGLAILLALAGRLGSTARVLASKRGMAALVPPSILGTYLAFLLMMAGVALAPAAVAAVLLATVPVWSLLLAARLEKRPIRGRELVGTAIAIAGVAWVAMAR